MLITIVEMVGYFKRSVFELHTFLVYVNSNNKLCFIINVVH